MLDTIHKRRVTPLTPCEYGYLRIQLITSPGLPAPPYTFALPASRPQALLLLSLACEAGLEPAQLAGMRIDALLHPDGSPRDHVHIRAETTKARLGRKVPMHPDISRDAREFYRLHPGEQWVAFVRKTGAPPNRQQMSAHGLSKWFGSLFRGARLGGLSARSGPKMFRDSALGR